MEKKRPEGKFGDFEDILRGMVPFEDQIGKKSCIFFLENTWLFKIKKIYKENVHEK